MIVSHKHGFIFIKTEKTAGTSIEIFLSRHCGKEDTITPVHPPVEGHKARNYEGRFNPLPELVSGSLIDPAYEFFGGSAASAASAIGNGVRRAKSSLGDLYRQRKFYNHIPAYKVRARVSEKVWRNYFKFCVERNPWDKTLSHYHMLRHRGGGGLSFDEYIARGRFCLNYPKYTDRDGKRVLADHVIKYENLLQELGEVFDLLGVPFDGSLEVSAKSEYRDDRGSHREAYTEEQRKIIEEVFRPEIQMHGYQF